MIYLTTKEIVYIHETLVKRTGGSDGLRDRGLLESAASSAHASFADYEQYPSIEEKSARLAFSLISNHAFADGNKRIGIAVMLVTLKLNDVHLSFTQEELICIGLSVAGGTAEYEDILNWINSHKQERK